MKIDSHHHFWRYSAEEYPWINQSMRRIARDYLPEDFQAEIEKVGVDGVVTVQARQTLEETRWLLELAEEHDFIQGVVGWVPLADSSVRDVLEEFADQPYLKAVRHVVHDEPDDRFILGQEFNAGVAQLKDYGLAYDILIFERHLPKVIEFVDRHPNQVFIVDHIAKPRIADGVIEPWGDRIADLASRPNVFCKWSGVVTEANWRVWTIDQLRPYFEVVVGAFSPQRLMFGSDWPVCLLACEYARWHEVTAELCSTLSDDEQQWVFGKTAARAYRLET